MADEIVVEWSAMEVIVTSGMKKSYRSSIEELDFNGMTWLAAGLTVAAGTSTMDDGTAGLTGMARRRREAAPTQTGGPNLDCRDGCGVATATW